MKVLRLLVDDERINNRWNRAGEALNAALSARIPWCGAERRKERTQVAKRRWRVKSYSYWFRLRRLRLRRLAAAVTTRPMRRM